MGECTTDMSRIKRTCALGLLAVVPFATSPAVAATPKPVKRVLKDCGDGKINKKHKLKVLKKAKKKIPADLKQYSDCKPAINKAIKKAKKAKKAKRA